MKKWIKWGMVFAILHVVIFTTSVYIDTKMPSEYVAIGALFTFVELIYELPLMFIIRIFNINLQSLSVSDLFFNYIIGSLLYFFIGVFLYYLFRNRTSRKVR
jgi:hypothetical protein